MIDKASHPRSALRRLLASEAAGGIVLLAASALAMIVANSPWSDAYSASLARKIGPLSALHWINDGLMALFFLLVGLELKREWLVGALSSWHRRVLPGAAAIAGMAVPASLYVAFNRHTPADLRGWAIPAATDIAFALGVLALLGKRAPASLKLLLTAIAVVDDLGAILIIALFYTAGLALLPLAAALAGLALLALLNRMGVRRLWPYLLIGAGIWYAVLLSGVHATVAGVAVAMTIPLDRSARGEARQDAPLIVLEHALAPFVAFGIVPIFGFANAGVRLGGDLTQVATGPIALGIAVGLLIGKQIGIFGTCWTLIRLGWATLPKGASWGQLYGMTLLCGIGFTMSLFIGGLAFGDGELAMAPVKIGILGGSLLSAVGGYALLRSGRAA